MSVIFLNGCTSAGKSSIAKHLQDRLPTPHLLTGIDDAFAMLPAHYHNHPDGFFFDRDADNLVRLNFGPFGLATLKSHHRAAAAIARSGVDLILDEVIQTPELRRDWLDVLQGLDVFFVGVHCDLEELERREIARGDRLPGQARGQLGIVHKGMTYDLEIDSTNAEPVDLADEIIQVIAGSL
ncbi:MAG: AAA family ATPase [Pseudomonadota bacterium]